MSRIVLHVLRHVLADAAVAARGATRQQAVLVAHVQRQAVDLGLGDERRAACSRRGSGNAAPGAGTRPPRRRPWRCRGTASAPDGCTLPKSATGGAPTRCEGLSGRTRSGKRASSAWLRRRRRSYSASRSRARRSGSRGGRGGRSRRRAARARAPPAPASGARPGSARPWPALVRPTRAIRLAAAARAASVTVAPASMRAISSRRSGRRQRHRPDRRAGRA